eukprot:1193209-Prorocentrum_minimum.AAC.4
MEGVLAFRKLLIIYCRSDLRLLTIRASIHKNATSLKFEITEARILAALAGSHLTVYNYPGGSFSLSMCMGTPCRDDMDAVDASGVGGGDSVVVVAVGVVAVGGSRGASCGVVGGGTLHPREAPLLPPTATTPTATTTTLPPPTPEHQRHQRLHHQRRQPHRYIN